MFIGGGRRGRVQLQWRSTVLCARLSCQCAINAIHQLDKMRVPEHAAVAETVQAAVSLKAPSFKGLVNACLRKYMRETDELLKATNNPVCQWSHPSWFIKRIQNAYPDSWQTILSNNLERSPMWLRVHNPRPHPRMHKFMYVFRKGEKKVVG